jgi:catechol 2,3-dioxygenase-like lactoylglutathione lyase family enzyme
MPLLTGGLHHISIRTTDLARAKRFYMDTIGFHPVRETDGVVLLNAHGTLFGVLDAAPQTSPEDRFDPFRVGLDHIALAVDDAESLHELKRQLDAAGVSNNGVEDDTLTGARYIAFYDPDGIAWELYSMPASAATANTAGGSLVATHDNAIGSANTAFIAQRTVTEAKVT